MAAKAIWARLFRRSDLLASADARQRLDAIARLSGKALSRSQPRLLVCAETDTDPAVRVAAIGKLDDLPQLRRLLSDPRLAEAAAERLANLPAPSDHALIRKARMRRARDAESAIALISMAEDSKELATLYACCPQPLRAALLPRLRLSGEAALSALEKLTRSRDKGVNRMARQEVRRLREAQHASAEHMARAQELSAALGRSDQGRGSGARVRYLQKQLAACCDRIEQQAGALSEFGVQPPDLGAWRALVAQSLAPLPTPKRGPGFAALADAFARLGEQLAVGAPLDALREQRDSLTRQWLAEADKHPPRAAEHAVFEQVSHRYQALVAADRRLQQQGWPSLTTPQAADDWPESSEQWQALWRSLDSGERIRKTIERRMAALRWPDWAEAPEVLRTARKQLAAWQRYRQTAEAQQTRIADSLAEQVAMLSANLEQGHLQAASELLVSARQLARSLPESRAAQHGRTLTESASRIKEWQSWQTYATAPRRAELLQAMSQLAEEPLSPPDQAARIKTLRAEWRQMGRPASGREHGELKRFNQLADQAFEPCRAWYAEQAEKRSANLRARQAICEQLQSYVQNTDWKAGDMRAAEAILRKARNEWRGLYPVDRAADKPVATQFEALQSEIHAHILKARERNLKAKQSLVEEMAALADGGLALDERIEAAKGLQERWRSVGSVARGADQPLWKAFRQHADAIFAARESERQRSIEQQQAARLAAEQVCATLEDALQAPEAAQGESLAARLRAELAKISLSAQARRQIERRFDAAAEAWAGLLRSRRAAAQREDMARLKALDLLVSRAEVAGEPLPPVTHEFSGRGAPGCTAGVELPSVADQLLRLTLLAEIHADVQSPAEDADQRLALQVETLNERMTQGASAQPRELVAEWCRIGPKPAELDPLRERFFAALQALAQLPAEAVKGRE